MGLEQGNLFYGLRKKMTDEQEYMANSIIDKHVVFSNSGSGTGKTTIAFASLYYLWELGKIDKIFYIFSPVQESTLGYRPGTTKEKEADYTGPIFGAMTKINLMPEKATDERYGMVDIKSHTFFRGEDHEKVGVIIDEAQNYTKDELKKILTRFHDNCHIAVIGHSRQIDLKNPNNSGFIPMLEHFAKLKDRVAIATLTKDFRGWISRHADSIDMEEE